MAGDELTRHSTFTYNNLLINLKFWTAVTLIFHAPHLYYIYVSRSTQVMFDPSWLRVRAFYSFPLPGRFRVMFREGLAAAFAFSVRVAQPSLGARELYRSRCRKRPISTGSSLIVLLNILCIISWSPRDIPPPLGENETRVLF